MGQVKQISEEQKKDATDLAAAIMKEKADGFEQLGHISRLDAEQLRHRGHADVGSAMVYTLKYYEKNVKKLTDAFFRKWPDA